MLATVASTPIADAARFSPRTINLISLLKFTSPCETSIENGYNPLSVGMPTSLPELNSTPLGNDQHFISIGDDLAKIKDYYGYKWDQSVNIGLVNLNMGSMEESGGWFTFN